MILLINKKTILIEEEEEGVYQHKYQIKIKNE